MSLKNETQTSASKKKSEGWNDVEKAAMRASAKEMKAEARMGKDKAAGEQAVQAAIAAMKDPDRSMAQRIHEIVTATAPDLMPKTWYGMPAYANAEGKIICFFQAAQKYNTRYSTFGFQPDARLDEGNMWAAGFAIVALTATEEAAIIALVKKAVS